MAGSKQEDRQAREARLAEALRANLRRRKAQGRGRDAAETADEGRASAPEPESEQGT